MEDLFLLMLIVVILAVVSFFLYFLGSYLQIKLNAFKKRTEDGLENEVEEEFRAQINYLMVEQEDLKEEIKNMRKALGGNSKELGESYEEEQMRIDNDRNLFNY